ncbi:MAG: DNA-binding NtrC family response regulator [Bacteriovoracaceae bacterium]|jgi:DNA-binding NtrC family response regulator
MKVILIDDQVDVCEIMTMILEDELQATVESFQDTASASIYLESKGFQVSLIICDFKLPQENGVEFYEKVKDKGIPFILMTGMFFKEGDAQVSSFRKGKNNKIIYKPVDEVELLKEINSIL